MTADAPLYQILFYEDDKPRGGFIAFECEARARQVADMWERRNAHRNPPEETTWWAEVIEIDAAEVVVFGLKIDRLLAS